MKYYELINDRYNEDLNNINVLDFIAKCDRFLDEKTYAKLEIVKHNEYYEGKFMLCNKQNNEILTSASQKAETIVSLIKAFNETAMLPLLYNEQKLDNLELALNNTYDSLVIANKNQFNAVLKKDKVFFSMQNKHNLEDDSSSVLLKLDKKFEGVYVLPKQLDMFKKLLQINDTQNQDSKTIIKIIDNFNIVINKYKDSFYLYNYEKKFFNILKKSLKFGQNIEIEISAQDRKYLTFLETYIIPEYHLDKEK